MIDLDRFGVWDDEDACDDGLWDRCPQELNGDAYYFFYSGGYM